jgi:hypothetical protein
MSTAPPTPPRRRRRWLILPILLLLLLAGSVVWAYVRGTVADTRSLDPDTAGRPVAQVYEPPDGKTCVRAAVLLPYPREQVWRTVTDYPRYDEFLPYLTDISTEPTKDGCHMTGGAKSAVSGYWDFAIDIHERKPDKEPWTATWDQTGGKQVLLNRGGWTLFDRGKETLLVLTLEAEVKGHPTFILRNVFLHRLPLVLEAVEGQLEKEARE